MNNSALIKEREEAVKPASEVKTYFDPSAFEWVGRGVGRGALLRTKEKYVRFNGRTIYISAEACRAAGFTRGERVIFGLNKKYFAIRKAGEGESGLLLTMSGKKSCALVISGAGIRKVAKDILGRIEVIWDSQMLVGRRPENGECPCSRRAQIAEKS